MKAGFTRRLEDDWIVSLNYARAWQRRRVRRHHAGVPRAGRGFGGNPSRRAIVLSLNKTF